jgi:hypothetical protein
MTEHTIAARAALALACTAAACGTPTPQLHILLSGGPSQACPSTDCTKVSLDCDAVMSIRIIDPKDPTAPFLKQCDPIPLNGAHDMCSLRKVDLDPTPIPVRDLEVQVAIYPLSSIPVDPVTKELQCPTKVVYSGADGYPVEQSPSPSLGGHAYYHPGDAAVNVTLGCTDLRAINEDPVCIGPPKIDVTATVYDFDTRYSLGGTPSLASQLRVWVGEPRAFDTGYVLTPSDERELMLQDTDLISTWQGGVDLPLQKYVCVEVLEDGPQNTSALRCKLVTPGPSLDLAGVRISKDTLGSILKALNLSDVPPEGLTVGVVVDQVFNAVSGVTVNAGGKDVKYLARPGVLEGTATSSLGIFVSADAPFGTVFSTSPAQATIPAVGGKVTNKVTIVILQPLGALRL